MEIFRRGMVYGEENAPVPWYPARDAAMAPYEGAHSPYAPLPESAPQDDVSETALTEPPLEHLLAEHADEQQRRRFLNRHEPLLPANQFGDSLAGHSTNASAWRDVIDASITLALVLNNGTLDTPFTLNGAASATYSGLSPALQQLLRDVRTPRLALVVRQFNYGPTTAGATGIVLASLVTSSGDTLPLGCYAPSTPANELGTQLAAPTAMTDLSGIHHLLMVGAGLAGAVNAQVQLSFSFIAVHPHTIGHRFSDMFYNE